MRWINAENVIHSQIYDDEHEDWSEREMTIEEFLDAFTDEGCPTVVTQPEQQWIPCSERLPEEGGYYLTTTIYQEVYCDYWNGDNFGRTEMVIAWMPLPDPWEGEDNGQNT